ncbi:MAG TPA: hypothetical protein VLA31_05690, partial [Burkholderiaceae bacterium]|nr:hypothetical protein [Burkholderiaceae bacterium]
MPHLKTIVNLQQAVLEETVALGHGPPFDTCQVGMLEGSSGKKLHRIFFSHEEHGGLTGQRA